MGVIHSTAIPDATEAAKMCRREPDNKQAKLLNECARKIIKSAKEGVLVTACSPLLDAKSIAKLCAHGYEVDYIKDDPDWPYRNVSFHRVSWERAASAVKKQ